MKLTCNLTTACRGVLLICLPVYICSTGRTMSNFFGGRLAGSDFVVSPESTSKVGVTLTSLGEQIASGPGGFRAVVLVDLLDYGIVLYPGMAGNSSLTLTSTDPPAFPAGATASCGGPVFVGPHTSCPFAQAVKKAYMRHGPYGNATVTASSPVTGQTYVMQCTVGSPDVCKGGTNALVEFYY